MKSMCYFQYVETSQLLPLHSFSEIQKKKSRDAARQRRGQQNDEFSELAGQLPVMPKATASLDRLCVMRLSNSFVKMKHIIRQITGEHALGLF